MEIALGRAKVGKGLPVYIVFEAGPTHTGLESAKKLSKCAKNAGANAIKFQIADHNNLISNRNLMFSYDVLKDKENNVVETITEPLIDIWERRYMPLSDWRLLKNYCDEIGIDFFATIFSEDLVDFVEEIGCHSIKIASQDINYYDLICYAAQKKMPIQIDTGGATLGEVEQAVDWIRNNGNEKIIINHCPSGYPARLQSINLKVIETLQQMYQYPIAFSDHTPGWEMDIAAVALGANIIEKTISLDRTTRSCEHMMSLEPDDMSPFIKIIREMETALGNSRRIMCREEVEKRENIRRSAYLKRDVEKGEKFLKNLIEFRRPGLGIKPDEYQHYLGRTFTESLKQGTMVTAKTLG